jgi:dipeptidyl aminopeptidase/acylaminoacyl peptidase
MRNPTRFLPLLALTLALPAAAQGTPKFDFTIQNIMRGPEVYGREPSNVQWTADGQWIYFMWNAPGTDWRMPMLQYRVRAEPGATPEQVTGGLPDSVALSLANGVRSPDGTRELISFRGDLYERTLATGAVRRLTQTNDIESNGGYSADGKTIYFVRDDNVYAERVDDGFIRQLTDIRAAGESGTAGGRGGRGGFGGGFGGARAGRGGRGSAADSGDSNPQRASLERQQRELFQVIRDREWQDSVGRSLRGTPDTTGRLRTLHLLANESVSSIDVSPNGKAALLTTFIRNSDARGTEVPEWVTSSGYVENINGRTKVGDVQSGGRIIFMTLPEGRTQVLQLTPDDTTGPGSRAQVVGWNDDGSRALVHTETAHFKYRYYYTVSDAGTPTQVDVLHDTAWVGGPCAFCAGWFDGGRRLYFVSEASGYAQLYSEAADGSDRKPLTSGNWEVQGVALSNDGKSFYLTTNERSPQETQLYRMSVNGGARTMITTGHGSHATTLSPDESKIADVYSTAENRPPELFLMNNQAGARESQITTSPTAAWLAFPWINPKITHITADDGAQVPARLWEPQAVGARPNGAAVIFVHGAGYLQEVVNYWGPYPREFMFNQYLASHGYVVLDLDYRASAGYGRDWRTAIYRWMGGRDLKDEVDGSRWLTKTYGIPPQKIGIYGGSYGGFMTLMALFTAPDDFGAGGALRSVTDWAHYNHGYTARILNFPQDDTLAYHRSSPIFYADGLKDPLIMFHGMVDTNVEYEDIVRLEQRLIELGKTGWWLRSYPVENHGFVRPDSWTDEYSHLFTLFETTIRTAK